MTHAPQLHDGFISSCKWVAPRVTAGTAYEFAVLSSQTGQKQKKQPCRHSQREVSKKAPVPSGQ